MNPRQLFIEQDGDHVHFGWACGECRTGYAGREPRELAESCCQPRYCEDCGTEIERHGYLSCSPCRWAKKLRGILAGELVSIDDAGDGPFCDWDNDGWYYDLGSWVEEQAERLAETPDAAVAPVVELTERREWAPDVESWLEGLEEEYLHYAEMVEPCVLDDHREEISAAQAIINGITPNDVYEGCGRYVDVRSLHGKVHELAKEWA